LRAAKAAGIDVGAWYDGASAFFVNFKTPGESWWNPLTDDGDAFRLAVKLRILVLPNASDKYVVADHPLLADAVEEIYDADPCAATRRCIVRAAAAMAPTEEPK
jgi:hypothetical protein